MTAISSSNSVFSSPYNSFNLKVRSRRGWGVWADSRPMPSVAPTMGSYNPSYSVTTWYCVWTRVTQESRHSRELSMSWGGGG